MNHFVLFIPILMVILFVNVCKYFKLLFLNMKKVIFLFFYIVASI